MTLFQDDSWGSQNVIVRKVGTLKLQFNQTIISKMLAKNNSDHIK